MSTSATMTTSAHILSPISPVLTVAIDRQRLMDDIHLTAQWGEGQRWGDAPTETGMARLALSDSDKMVRDWFVQEVKEYGCKVQVDAMGNIFAIRPGRREGHPTFMGSHLDTQPAGGRYDGILGVLAGVAALRTLHESGIETEYPIGVVDWTNEEGARFPQCMMASAVWAGVTDVNSTHRIADIEDANVTVRSELERIGYLGGIPAHYTATPMAAHFELHIEQGPILEASNQCIGAVQGVQASKWFTITVGGRDSHTGATNFENRSDALLTSAQMILRSHQVATEFKSLASTGLLSLEPGSTNTVPGVVTFSLDLRSSENKKIYEMEEILRRDFESIAKGESVGTVTAGCTRGRGCSVSWKVDSDAKVANFDKDCIECIEKGSESLFGEQASSLTRKMYSGAGHDSVHTSTRVPTAMIFVPCREGITHNPTEYCSPTDCGNGAQVLLNAVLRYDHHRSTEA
ncbi:beta-alanine synthase [Colletotrichum nymphaeae SA-01]|uniref:Beta-alanine synthase n=1 Tax=Colletotrichum nymphaeae SA-01 TaxID=1460502 RepID=A0A135SCN9_9PEZI|nr:beta-alanine synthase [Colletotrichum nymphaeae SA-01]